MKSKGEGGREALVRCEGRTKEETEERRKERRDEERTRDSSDGVSVDLEGLKSDEVSNS